MTDITINTAQNVEINFKPASLGERILAFFIDLLIKFAYALGVYFISYKLFNLDGFFAQLDGWESMSLQFFIYSPTVFYTLIFEAWTNGQTPGKRIMKIRVVKIQGYQARFSDHLSRWIFRLVDVYLFIGLPGILLIIFTDKGQRFGDIVTDTTVISIKSNAVLNHRFLEGITEEYQVTFPTVIRLSDYDMSIIKKAYKTAVIQNDQELLKTLIAKIEQVAVIKKHTDDVHDFMQTVINDFNYLTSKR